MSKARLTHQRQVSPGISLSRCGGQPNTITTAFRARERVQPDANRAIRELLGQLNRRPFRKRREECRASLFEKIDRPALQPLPAERYDLSHWAQARVNIDYHVAF